MSNLNSIKLFIPELIIVATVLVGIIADLFYSKKKSYLTGNWILGGLILSLIAIFFHNPQNVTTLFTDMVALDPKTLFNLNLKLLDYLAPAIWKDTVIYTSGDSVVRAFNSKLGSIELGKTNDLNVWIRNMGELPTIAFIKFSAKLRTEENYMKIDMIEDEIPAQTKIPHHKLIYYWTPKRNLLRIKIYIST